MTERILVPYDGSEPAADALRYALERFPDPEVTVLYVVATPDGYWTAFEDDPTALPGYERATEQGEGLLADAATLADDLGHEVETEVVHGTPAARIVETAEAESIDTVVIGSHGREGVSRVLLGSVAETVVRRSPVPVLVVR